MENTISKSIKNWLTEDMSTRKSVGEAFKIGAKDKMDKDVINFAVELIRFQDEGIIDFKRLISIIREGDVNSALIRIEKYANLGHAQKNKQYILYVHCIYALCLGELKEQNCRKEICGIILDQLEKNILSDEESPAHWKNSCYPHNILVQISMELMNLGLDFSPLWKTRSVIEIDDEFKKLSLELAENGKPEAALRIVSYIRQIRTKSEVLECISESFAQAGHTDEALKTASEIIFEDDLYQPKYKAYSNIYSILKKQGRSKDAKKALDLTIVSIAQIIDDYNRFLALKDFSSRLANSGEFRISMKIINRIEAGRGVQNKIKRIFDIFSRNPAKILLKDKSHFWRSDAFMAVFQVSETNGFNKSARTAMNSALKEADQISLGEFKNEAFANISISLAELGKNIDAIKIVSNITSEDSRNESFKNIAISLSKQDKFEEALGIASRIIDGKNKCLSLYEISLCNDKKGNHKAANELLEEALSLASFIEDEKNQVKLLKTLSLKLAESGKTEKAYELIRQISDSSERNEILETIATSLTEIGKEDDALITAELLTEESRIINVLINISLQLFKKGKQAEASNIIENALKIANEIKDKSEKDFAFGKIAESLSFENRTEEALEIVHLLNEDKKRTNILNDIANNLSKEGQTKTAMQIMEQIASTNPVYYRNDLKKIDILFGLSLILSEEKKQDRSNMALEAAFKSASASIYWVDLIKVMKYLVLENLGRNKEANDAMNEAINDALSKKDEALKSEKLNYLSKILAEQGNAKEAFILASQIKRDWLRFEAYRHISGGLLLRKNFTYSDVALNNAHEIANIALTKKERAKALGIIAIELAKRGRTEEATKIKNECLSFYKSINDGKSIDLLNEYFANPGTHTKPEETLINIGLIQRIRKAAVDYLNETENLMDLILKSKGEPKVILEILDKSAIYINFISDEPDRELLNIISGVLDIDYLNII
jgi:tetratricopeptide (TPR) repeat protein